MCFHTPEYLKRVQTLCREHGVLLIFDEIITGSGCTGKLSACEHVDVVPDITCLDKALIGGYFMLSVAVTHKNIADTVSNGAVGCFIHEPTFMVNLLACAVADESVRLLVKGGWREDVARIEAQLCETLVPTRGIVAVREMRVLGAIGVVEMWESVSLHRLQPKFVERGV